MRNLVLLVFAALCAPACDEGSGNAENTATACRDGSDNDGDGFADCDDQDCWEFVFCGGADGDADAESSADTDADPDAESVDTAEEVETTPDGDDTGETTAADDGGDADVADDGDGGSACAPGDDGCGPTELCGDGLDNDCDGETDEGLSAEPTILCPVSFESLPSRWWVLRCEDLCTTAGEPCDCTWSIVPPAGSGSTEVPDRTAESTRVHLDAAGNFIVSYRVPCADEP